MLAAVWAFCVAPASAEVFGPEVASRFAPVVEFAGGERDLPASVPWYLEHSTLEWHNDDGCPSDPIRSQRPWSEAEIRALGEGGYATQARDGSCHKAGPRFTTSEHTRPTDGGRPPRLAPSDGFVLNLQGSSEAVRDGIPDTTPNEPRRYTGSPVYYESGDLIERGTSMGDYAYLTYWFFYAYDNGFGPQNHEGDWEGMSVIFKATSPGHYRPVALGLNQHSATQGIAWKERRFPHDRPLVFSAKGSHATYDHAFGVNLHTDTTGGGVLWETAAQLLPLANEPWRGYCGGWGQVGKAAESPLHLGDTTGPSGPGCVVNGRLIKNAIPAGWGVPAPVGQAALGDRGRRSRSLSQGQCRGRSGTRGSPRP
jgi:hypothetical protein